MNKLAYDRKWLLNSLRLRFLGIKAFIHRLKVEPCYTARFQNKLPLKSIALYPSVYFKCMVMTSRIKYENYCTQHNSSYHKKFFNKTFIHPMNNTRFAS